MSHEVQKSAANPLTSAISGAFGDVLSPKLRRMVLVSMGLAIVILGGTVWAALTLFVPLIPLQLLSGHALVLGLVQALSGFSALLLAIVLWLPVSSLIAGLFVDAAADAVDKTGFPDQTKGLPPSMVRFLPISLGFAAKAIALNILALPLALIPVVNVASFVGLNGWLMGREYFTMAAMRIADDQTVAQLRRTHGSAIYVAGLALAGMFVVPVLNLAAPLFGIALMVRLSRALVVS